MPREMRAGKEVATQFRSGEELEMRRIIVPEMRTRWPGARIVHELPLRYSTNRIDLAAILADQIVSVEIKSSRDTTERLEDQVRAFLPVSSQIIVALAPAHNEQLPAIEKKGKNFTSYTPQHTPAQAIVSRIGSHTVGIWSVCHAAGTIEETRGCYPSRWQPWTWAMLDMLWVEELRGIAERHRLGVAKRPNHHDLCQACATHLTGAVIVREACATLRARSAFGADSDPPITSLPAHSAA